MLDVSCDDGCRGGVVCFNGFGGCHVGGGDSVVVVLVVLVVLVRWQ